MNPVPPVPPENPAASDDSPATELFAPGRGVGGIEGNSAAETVPPDSGAGAPATPAAEPARIVVPGYAVLGELGRGGMGVVYLARQLRADRDVALKMVRAGDQAGDAELARFRAEAEALT